MLWLHIYGDANFMKVSFVSSTVTPLSIPEARSIKLCQCLVITIVQSTRRMPMPKQPDAAFL